MIFENAYGDWIKGELNNKIRSITNTAVVKLYQEVSYKPLYHDTNTIALIINGGNAARSTVNGIDQNVMPISISIICREDYKNAVRNAMDGLQEEFNAVAMEMKYLDNVTGNESLVRTKSIFNTPILLDERDYPTKYETIKATILQMTASVIYGKNAYINPTSFKLSVGGKIYPIEHIASYNMASSPAYDEFQSQGDTFIERNDLTQCVAFSFSLYRMNQESGADTTLQEVLDNEHYCRDNGLRGQEIKLLAYTNPNDSAYYQEIKITKYSLVEAYVNHSSAYQLTLGR